MFSAIRPRLASAVAKPVLNAVRPRFFSQAAVARSNIASLHTLTEDEQLLKES
ncbi:hypothetical protein BGZ52_012552, partial [Haplosporangium bisporale]